MISSGRFLRFARFTAVALVGLVLVFGALDVTFPLSKARLFPAASAVVLDNQGALLRGFLAPDQMWRVKLQYEEVSPQLREAVVCYEDRHFRSHPGVNPVALMRAAWANLKAGKVVQGGSTITMQVARLIEPKPRTLVNKLVEMFRALQLEAHYSKDEILTLYFNHAPYGGNLVGAGAAARAYFGKPASQLSHGEAALLAAIPNSPNRYRPDHFPEAARIARDKVLGILFRCGRLSAEEYNLAKTETIRGARLELPFEAPHLAEYLRARYPDAERLHTTIDSRIQQLSERALEQHLTPLKSIGIENGAVVIINNRSRSVLALVGSAAFDDTAHGGQVNGALALRSPGSALKPFVYAFALDRGIISPRSLLYDVPVEYRGYRPVNYDEQFDGVVTAEEALVRSLNVPAINLAATAGGEEIYDLLKQGGLSSLDKPWSQYGLPLVLGGCEVTLLELTNLYACLASAGEYRPYRLLSDEPTDAAVRLFGAGASFIVTEMLAGLRRPELPSVWDAAANIPRVAWKTGTSLGKRDAWSIGYNPDYTIGVWIGNFDGRGNHGLVGAEVAAPLMLSLFEALAVTSNTAWFVAPPDVDRREVCAVSGMLPSPFCAATASELYIRGVSPATVCTVHELILVDKKTGMRLCRHCRGSRSCEDRICEKWPTAIATWMARNGYSIETIPEHNPNCPILAAGSAPVIVSPADAAEYRMRPEVKPEYQKILLDASVSNSTRTIYWFQNRKLIYTVDPRSQVFLTPTPGQHDLICLDDAGRSSQVSIRIY